MSSDGTGERLPNGLPAEFAHAHMTGNLIQGTFADAPHWAEPDPNWAGSEQQTINICIDHPELGVRVLGVLTWGGDVDLAHPPQAAPSAESTPATPDDSNRPTTASTMGDSRKPGYTPEMQAAYDDFKRIDPDASDQYIDDLVRHRFRDGTDRVASINRLLHFKDDVQKRREQIDPKEYEVGYESIKQALSDPHNYLFAASMLPSFLGSIPMVADGLYYQYHDHDGLNAAISYTAAVAGVVGDAAAVKAALKGIKVAAETLNESGHVTQIVKASSKVEEVATKEVAKAEKLATKATAEAEELAEKETGSARAADPDQLVSAANPKPESISKEAGGRAPELPSHSTKTVRAEGKSSKTEKDPYKKPSGYRKDVRKKVFENEKNSDGVVLNPGPDKEVIDPNKPWDMGHRPGFEFRKLQEEARKRGISRQQFLDEHNRVEHYRPETPRYNRSHKGEAPDDDYRGPRG